MKIIETADGSKTLFSEAFNEIYHSRNGALTESQYVYIDQGLGVCNADPVHVLEVGFGTGLNAFLVQQFAEAHRRKVFYTGYELFPVPENIWRELKYGKERGEHFAELHQCTWDEPHRLSEFFQFTKMKDSVLTADFQKLKPSNLVFFDAFAPEKQPEMWTLEIFKKLFAAMAIHAILVTYCSKGEVKRRIREAGFELKRLKGPPGKWQMLRARKVGITN